jgi:DNA polymerase I-like protein with 3'-5' exonuclease and polymerase domains
LPTISLKAPPPPFACATCETPDLLSKAGPGCHTCPAFKGSHYFPYGTGDEACDVLVVGDVPEVDTPRPGSKFLPRAEAFHSAFQEDGAKVLKSAIGELQREALFQGIRVRYTYGVRCAVESPSKQVIQHCQVPLKLEVAKVARTRAREGMTRNLVVLACGTAALRSFGIGVASEKEAAGRVYEAEYGGEKVSVVFTMSLKAQAVAVGKYSSLMADLERAFRLARDRAVEAAPRALIEKGYVYPTTLEEVEALCDHIIAYTDEGVDPANWAIAFDTETNTLYPHKDGLQLVAVSFAWDQGLACTIPLWHAETPYDPAAALLHVLRVLAAKPCITFNGKYDLKVMWKVGADIPRIKWDVMLAEHVLEEDKKGQYSLKYLVKQFIPSLSGYEDRLKKQLEDEDTEGQVETELSRGRVVKVPAAVAEALERLKLKPTFQPKPATKKLQAVQASFEAGQWDDKELKKLTKGLEGEERLKVVEAYLQDYRLVINAKVNGEFEGAAEKAAKKKREAAGGFENVPLDELKFYAAVDADATRRLAIIQRTRMEHEDETLARMRRAVAIDLQFSPHSPFQIRPLCTVANPLQVIVKERAVPLQRALAKIEYQGIRIDRAYLSKGYALLDAAVSEAESRIYNLAGGKFNINSPAQLARHLYDHGVGYEREPGEGEKYAALDPENVRVVGGRTMYKPAHYTVKGALQTNEAALRRLKTQYNDQLANYVMAYKKAKKLQGSFWVNLDKLSQDGYIHPNYNIPGTATRRLSSSSGVKGVGFNNQNLPKNEIGGVKCKALFLPDEDDMIFVNSDAKGAEATIFAIYCGDETMIAYVREGKDLHSLFASRILSPAKIGAGLHGRDRALALLAAGIDEDHAWSYEDFANRDELKARGIGAGDKKKRETWADAALVDYAERLDKHRDNIKRCVFGMLFGAGPGKVAEIAGIPEKLAKDIFDGLFAEFPRIKVFMEQTKWELRTFQIVESYFGSRRRFQIHNAPRKLLGRAERQAGNFKIQESNATIVLMVLCAMSEALIRDLGGRMLLTVHDSLGFQVPKKYAGQVKDLMYEYGTRQVAEMCPWLQGVPYRWDMKVGDSYACPTKLDDYVAEQETAKYTYAHSEQTWTPQASWVLPEEPKFEGLTDEEIEDDFRNFGELPMQPKGSKKEPEKHEREE